jgi:hypothetical protein
MIQNSPCPTKGSANFTAVSRKITVGELTEILIKRKYKAIEENRFVKTITGDESPDTHYEIAIATPKNFTDIAEKMNPSPYFYNICFVFANENLVNTQNFFNRYITETLVNYEMLKKRDKACIAPVIITENEIYFIKNGSVFGNYRFALREALKLLGIKQNLFFIPRRDPSLRSRMTGEIANQKIKHS